MYSSYVFHLLYVTPNSRSHMNRSVVYVLTITSTGNFYIGSTSHEEVRFKRHISELENNCHHSLLLQKAWDNSDKEFFINVIETDNREEAFKLEQEMILKAFNSNRKHLLCNIGLNSRAGDNLTNHPYRNDIISKRAKSQKTLFDKMSSEERKIKYGKSGDKNGMYGKTHTPEVRKKLSEMFKGHSFNKGIKLSKEHIAKISERQKLRTGEKNSFYGRTHSPEVKMKMREFALNRKPANVRKIQTNEGVFNSCREASKFHGISEGLITYRVKSDKYPEWKYIT